MANQTSIYRTGQLGKSRHRSQPFLIIPRLLRRCLLRISRGVFSLKCSFLKFPEKIDWNARISVHGLPLISVDLLKSLVL